MLNVHVNEGFAYSGQALDVNKRIVYICPALPLQMRYFASQSRSEMMPISLSIGWPDTSKNASTDASSFRF